MIRTKLPLRRPLAIVGATFLGLTAALVVAAPASAHHSEVKVKGECNTTTGEWDVTWTIRSVAPGGVSKFRFTEAQAQKLVGETRSELSIPGISTTERGDYPYEVNKNIEFKQSLPAETTGVSLAVKAEWDNKHNERDTVRAQVTFTGTCAKDEEEPPPATSKPTATVGAECDGTVVVRLSNAEDATAPAKFTVAGSGDFEQKVTVPAGEEKSVTVPAANASKVTVTEEGLKEPLFDKAPAAAEDCVEPGEPSLSYAFTCDELVWEVDNPEDGKSITVTFTPNKGEAKTVTVEPGKVETVKFPAEEGLTVTPSSEGVQGKPLAWEKPENCESGGGGGEGELPLTGAAAGGIAAGAALLLVAGIVLYVVARRRRVTFTA
ncbi:cell wall anchor protein [Plantactinospora sp. CA-290183]|uniref:cell wall anchor protein n=1 Tax=Plantactinospora sp. CA-290183 TaxID=3240006 RepID=UPI003D928244